MNCRKKECEGGKERRVVLERRFYTSSNFIDKTNRSSCIRPRRYDPYSIISADGDQQVNSWQGQEQERPTPPVRVIHHDGERSKHPGHRDTTRFVQLQRHLGAPSSASDGGIFII